MHDTRDHHVRAVCRDRWSGEFNELRLPKSDDDVNARP